MKVSQYELSSISSAAKNPLAFTLAVWPRQGVLAGDEVLVNGTGWASVDGKMFRIASVVEGTRTIVVGGDFSAEAAALGPSPTANIR